jgi:hypothetical protein
MVVVAPTSELVIIELAAGLGEAWLPVKIEPNFSRGG